jgi:hypothetical protein
LVIAAKEMTMAKKLSLHRANAVRNGRRLAAMGRAKRLFNIKRQKGEMIPAEVLRKLASLNLPANEFVYQACLEKLLRGADAT